MRRLFLLPLLAALAAAAFWAADNQAVATSAPCPQKRVVVVHFTAVQRPVLRHALDAIAEGQPLLLHIDRSDADRHRDQSLAGLPKVPGKDLDEYPPALSREGGTGADVRAIDQHANRSQGASMRAQLACYPDGHLFRYAKRVG